MAVLVTGAAGFIGASTSRVLLERGDEVVGIDNLNDYYDPSLKQARLRNLQQQFGNRFRFKKLGDTLSDCFTICVGTVSVAYNAGIICSKGIF